MAVGWSQRARTDLGAIFAHIAADNRGAAERWIGRILEHADLAAQAPLLGRMVPELGQADIAQHLVAHLDSQPKCRGRKEHSHREGEEGGGQRGSIPEPYGQALAEGI